MEVTCIEEQEFPAVSFPKYVIFWHRITDRLTQVFNPKELKEYLRLYEEAQKDPKSVKREIEAFVDKYPNLPEVYNLLSYVYVRLKKIRKVEKLIQLNYEKNPRYLFAKINFADQCLRKGKLDLIPEIFENTFDLNKLYPDRQKFHFSEILGFMTLMGFYELAQNQIKRAKDYLTYSKMIDPEDSATKHLEKKIYRPSLKEKLKRKIKAYSH